MSSGVEEAPLPQEGDVRTRVTQYRATRYGGAVIVLGAALALAACGTPSSSHAVPNGAGSQVTATTADGTTARASTRPTSERPAGTTATTAPATAAPATAAPST